MVLIRPFEAGDVARLTTLLHRAYAELGAAGLNFTAVDQSEETTLRRASAGASWVMEDRGVLVGTITVSLPPEPALRELTSEASVERRAWLNQLAVDPTRRGEGLSRQLSDVGYDWCASRGVTSMGLDTARPASHLVNLYRGWGFSVTDAVQWPGKTYESVIMTRMLT